MNLLLVRTVGLLSLLTLFSIPAAAEDAVDACIAKKVEALGKDLHCRLDNASDEFASGDEVSDRTCDARLERRIARADRIYGAACPTSRDGTSLRDWTENLSKRVVHAVDGTHPTVDFEQYMAERGPKDPDPRQHMRALIEYAEQNRAAAVKFCAQQDPKVSAAECAGGIPFCAFVVDRNMDSGVARACNHGAANPMLHGEVAVINAAANVFQARGIPFTSVASGHDLYTTGEPCAMCSGSIMWAGFKTAFFGSTVGYLSNFYSQIQISNWELAGLWTECQEDPFTVRTRVVGPIMEDENNALFDEFGFKFCPAASHDH